MKRFPDPISIKFSAETRRWLKVCARQHELRTVSAVVRDIVEAVRIAARGRPLVAKK